ncbi:hypothetical protein [Rhizobium sp. NFR12]|uniref:hypothetical protein n=1 Tax=Rhizobium sp. NFR12 TaxID=1566261 RepID=UPI0013B01955|nr:hypothetical protein [Rhizobium sp. NFR12]
MSFGELQKNVGINSKRLRMNFEFSKDKPNYIDTPLSKGCIGRRREGDADHEVPATAH